MVLGLDSRSSFFSFLKKLTASICDQRKSKVWANQKGEKIIKNGIFRQGAHDVDGGDHDEAG